MKCCLYDKFPSFSINQKDQKNAYLKSPLELILTYLNSELFLLEIELWRPSRKSECAWLDLKNPSRLLGHYWYIACMQSQYQKINLVVAFEMFVSKQPAIRTNIGHGNSDLLLSNKLPCQLLAFPAYSENIKEMLHCILNWTTNYM